MRANLSVIETTGNEGRPLSQLALPLWLVRVMASSWKTRDQRRMQARQGREEATRHNAVIRAAVPERLYSQPQV
jgi:hypothetical protein